MWNSARSLWWKLRTSASRGRLDRDLHDELQFHREMLERDFLHAGLRPDEARSRARRRLGNATYLAEESRMHWGFPTLESVGSDIRFAARSLRNTPTFTLAALLTLALGVGAAVAIFSVVDAIVLRPLPYRDGAALVSLFSTPPGQEGRLPLSYPDFRDVQRQNRVFANVVYARGEPLRVRGEMGAEELLTAFVTEGLFPLMGTQPLVGRALGPDDGRADAERVIVIGQRVWRERFGGDPGILGRRINTLEGSYTVVGVMPESFAWPEWAQAWSPIVAAPFSLGSLARRSYRVDARTIARIAPSTSFARAQHEMQTIGARLATAYPADDGELTIRAVSLRDDLTGPVRRPLLVLLGAVGGLLLIACANVANLSLARASARSREVGVRLAIGASRGRIARQLLVESGLLALAGGALGTVFAFVAVRGLVALAPPDLPRLVEVAVDARVLLFALALCALSALLFGIAPALAASAADLMHALKGGARGSSTAPAGVRLQSGFVVLEIAIACALVVGSALLAKSFANMRGADPGFDTERLVSLRIEPVESRYDTPEERLLLYDSIRDAVARIPGVARVSYINHSPATRSGVFSPLESDGDPRPDGQTPSAAYRLVDSGYFETMGQRVLRGRALGAADMFARSTAVVVNQTLARRLWGTQDPIGRRIVVYKQMSGPDVEDRVDGRVVGVVEDIKDYDISAASWAEAYLPFPVNPWRSMYLAIRTSGDPEAVIPAVQRTVRSIDPDLPVRRTATVDQLLDERLARRSFNATIVSAFGIVALLLASFGVYGIVAYAVVQRTQEIGIRTALGARPSHLMRMFVGRATLLAVAGVGLGLGLSALFGRAMRTMLFGVAPTDVSILTQTTAATIVIAALAAFLPARRALRVDPLIAMRSD
ncbi:MAG TPA: ABC transporter permease [Gemmatimonadaceae bacterium]|nr:ABC transporter permease [Gemmatimonadaceae bacterium]